MTNKTFVYKKIPTGVPVPGEHLVVEDRGFDLEAPPPPGGLTLSVLYASFDPYLRGKMRDPKVPSYSPAFEANTPVSNDCIARVLKSDAPGFAPGDVIIAFLPMAEYATLTAEQVGASKARKIDNRSGLKDLALFIGPLGMPGLTAYSSLYEIGKPKKGETIFVSSAAGAVGQIVGQLAKHEGLRVIGSVGSDAKLDFIINELGFDGGFNYKKERPADALARLAPQGLDIYYDNVGAEHLEAAIAAMNLKGRVVVSGMISGYNKSPEDDYGVKGLIRFVQRQLTMTGFLVFDPNFGPKYTKEHQEKVGQWLADGTFKAKLAITDGIDLAPEGFVGMLEGKNFGKSILKIKDE